MGDSIMASIIRATTTSGLQIAPDNSGSLQLQTNGTTAAVTIDTSQNVGIGTTSPVNLTGQKSVTINASGVARTDYQISGTTQGFVLAESGYLGIYTPSTQYLSLGTNDTERMRITSGGDLLMGGTSVSPSLAGGQIALTRASGLLITAGTDPIFRGYNTSSGGGAVVNILNNGNLTNTNGSYGAISDIKLKENIVDATPKLDDLMKVKVRHYNLIGDTNKQIGVVAQELETVFAGLIDETENKDGEGNSLGTSTKSVKYSVFIPMLIKAIQEQQTIINDLKARVEALEAK